MYVFAKSIYRPLETASLWSKIKYLRVLDNSREVQLEQRSDVDIGFDMPVTNYQFQLIGDDDIETSETVDVRGDGDATRLEGVPSTVRYDVCAVPIYNYGGPSDWFCGIKKRKK